MSAARIVAGFMPLLDCATLAAAAECGFAAQEGIDLRLVRETSWANIRDRLIVGQFQAAHMLGPMAVASSLGVGHLQVPLVAPLAMGVGGNAITASTALAQTLRDAGAPQDLRPTVVGAALRNVVSARATGGQAPLVFAMVYPFSCHHYELRYWLAASGIDPDQDVRLVVIPPPLLVAALREAQIDAFCVGEPWSSAAVAVGAGEIITTGGHIWHRSPEKVLALRRDWAEAHPDTLTAVLRAMTRAAIWCDDARNHAELAHLLSGPRYVGVPAELLQATLSGELLLRSGDTPVEVRNFIVFSRDGAGFPWPSHALWFYRQMVRWKQLTGSPSQAALAKATYRPDLYRAAVRPLRIEVPEGEHRIEHFYDEDGPAAHESGA